VPDDPGLGLFPRFAIKEVLDGLFRDCDFDDIVFTVSFPKRDLQTVPLDTELDYKAFNFDELALVAQYFVERSERKGLEFRGN
jgi:hypothetical protein